MERIFRMTPGSPAGRTFAQATGERKSKIKLTTSRLFGQVPSSGWPTILSKR
jgi:hypothetical protein